MATEYTREWMHFFSGCGIPDDVATMYALIFYENRIQKNMLLDLNKEYLRDMGITIMGDVIAILRNAKVVHEKYVRQQILLTDIDVPSNTINSTNRMLKHYTRNVNSDEVPSKVKVTVQNNKEDLFAQKQAQNVIVEDHKPSQNKTSVHIQTQSMLKPNLKKTKVRRILPENSRDYKIKMPLSTTEQSKKIFDQGKIRETKTVFDRLGESSVSSTTSETSLLNISNSNPQNSSIFSRLGEKTTSIVSSTSLIDKKDSMSFEQLQYVGILKNKSIQKKKVSSATMRADNEQQQSNKNMTELKGNISVKKRLGMNKKEAKPGINQIKGTMVRIKKPYNSISPIVDGSVQKSKTIETVVSTTTKNAIRSKAVRRKLDDDNEPNDSSKNKKVRFGSTTRRLIPSSNSSEPKNYPQLTMIISNRKSPGDSPRPFVGSKIKALNSGKLNEPTPITSRLGTKSMPSHLNKPVNYHIRDPITKKSFSVHDRLG